MLKNILSRRNRKTFNNLDEQQQREIIKTVIEDNFSPIIAKTVAKSMIDGFRIKSKQLYTDYVVKIDEKGISAEERENRINELLSRLRLDYLNAVKGSKEEKHD